MTPWCANVIQRILDRWQRKQAKMLVGANPMSPDDGEAWATLARVSVEMVGRRYDTSPPRLAAARSQAERAIRLAPDSVQAGLVMAARHAAA